MKFWNKNKISFYCSNYRGFLFEILQKATYRYSYVWVSHREYNIKFSKSVFPLIKAYSDEKFLFKVDGDYSQKINELEKFMIEFQLYSLLLLDEELTDIGDLNLSILDKNSGYILSKAIEKDILFLEKSSNKKWLF